MKFMSVQQGLLLNCLTQSNFFFHMLLMDYKYYTEWVYNLLSFFLITPSSVYIHANTWPQLQSMCPQFDILDITKGVDWQNSLWGFRNSGYLFLLRNSVKLYFSHNSKDICLTGPLERNEAMLPLIKNIEKNSAYIKSTPMAGFSPKLDRDWVFPRPCKDPKCDVNHIPAKGLVFLTICAVSQEVSLWHDRCQLWMQHSAQS